MSSSYEDFRNANNYRDRETEARAILSREASQYSENSSSVIARFAGFSKNNTGT